MTLVWDSILSECAPFCNVTIVCFDGVLESHKIIVASASDFLKKLMLATDNNEENSVIILPDFYKDQVQNLFSKESLQKVQNDYFDESRIKQELYDELLEIKAEPESLEQKCDINQFNEDRDYSQTDESQSNLELFTSPDPFSVNQYIQKSSKLRPILPKTYEETEVEREEKRKLYKETMDNYLESLSSVPCGVPEPQNGILKGTSFFNCPKSSQCRKRCAICENEAQRMRVEQNLKGKDYRTIYNSVRKITVCCTSCGRNCCSQCGEMVCRDCKLLIRTLQRVEDT